MPHDQTGLCRPRIPRWLGVLRRLSRRSGHRRRRVKREQVFRATNSRLFGPPGTGI